MSGCKFFITFAMGFLFDYTPEELATFTLEELEILQEADDFFSRADAIKRKAARLARYCGMGAQRDQSPLLPPDLART